MSFVKKSGSKLIATRLRQLSSLFWKERSQIYNEYNIQFKPNWGVVVMLMQEKPDSSVNDIANELGFAHTSVLKIIKDMSAAGYIKSKRDKKDSRRRMLSLTKGGLAQHKNNYFLMKSIEKVNKEVLKDTGLLKALKKVEKKLEESPFDERLKLAMAKTVSSSIR